MADNLSGETMIVQHIPLVHGQSVGGHSYTSGSKPRRPCTLSLTHTISLPERENPSNEAQNDDIQGWTSKSSSNKRTGMSDSGFGNTVGYSSTLALEPKINEADLHTYCKEYPFCQYGNSNGTKDKMLRFTKRSQYHCCSQCTISTTACNHNMKHSEQFGRVEDDQRILPDLEQHFHRNYEDTPILMDCAEQDWANENHNYADYISDSSCNSSDGVLVNFSAIYNKTNNAVPATPYDLVSPVKQSQALDSGHQYNDFKQIPCWSSCKVDPNCNIYQADCNGLSSQETLDITPCQGQLTYTNNYYKLVTCDLSSQSAASPAWSSLTSCPEAHSSGSMTPHTEYFLFRKPETQDEEVVEVNKSDFQADEDTELKRSNRTRKTSKDKNYRKTHHDEHKDQEPNNHEHISATRVSQSWNKYPCYSIPKEESLRRVLSCPSQLNLSKYALKQHKTSFAELACYRKSKSMVKNSKENRTCSKFPKQMSPLQSKVPLGQMETLIISKDEKESGSSELAAIPPLDVPETCLKELHNTKPKRPTSLPIQPFVLQPPSGKQTSNVLGSLIDHYMSLKQSFDLPSHSTLSPLENYTSILEVASCSATCSTCTPTPTEPYIWPHWAPPSPLIFQAHLDLKYESTKTVEASLPDKRPGEKHPCLDYTHRTLNSLETGHKKTNLKPFSNQQLQSFHYEQLGSYQTSLKCLAPEPRTTGTIFILPGAGQSNHNNEELNTASFHIKEPKKLPCFLEKEQQQHGDSSSLADRPPEEFCSSPDASNKFLPIDLLQTKDLLKSLGVAVDLIIAHFSFCTNPNEKFRLGNSSMCPRISQLVLDELCPAFQNILQDGLKPFKLDLIVGQRCNKPWSVVEASTQPGPSTRMLHSLVSVVKKCSKLTNHSMRLNAFFLGLLNLSALESWFWHLQTCVEVIAEYYHPWALLALFQDPMYKSLFQELLLLLQPLSELPFDLHLLCESRLQKRQEQNQPFIQESNFFSGCTFLKTPNRPNSDSQVERCRLKEKNKSFAPSQMEIRTSCSTNIHKILQGCGITVSKPSTREAEQESSVCSEKKKSPGWWLSMNTEHVVEANCSVPSVPNDDTLVKNDRSKFLVRADEVKTPKELRWARLFGSGISSPVKVEKAQQSNKLNQRIRPPLQWLQLGASKMDQLAQSVWNKETSRSFF